MASGQLFSRTTQALFFNYKQNPVQRMLDFDFLCGKVEGHRVIILSSVLGTFTVFCVCSAGRSTPSVAGIITPGSDGFQKLFFGQEEIAVPVHARFDSDAVLIHCFTVAYLDCQIQKINFPGYVTVLWLVARLTPRPTFSSISRLFEGVQWFMQHFILACQK